MIIARAQWGAKPSSGPLPQQAGPCSTVYVHHTAGPAAPALEQVRQAQAHAMSTHSTTAGVEPPHKDIDYSFLVSQQGEIFEGRGWGVIPAATSGHNAGSYAMCAIGNFDTVDTPSDALVTGLASIIADGVAQGHLTKDVQILGHRDVRPTACPGKSLYAALPLLRSAVAAILAPKPEVPPTMPDQQPANFEPSAFIYGDSTYWNRWLVLGGAVLHIGPALAGLLKARGVAEVLEHNHQQTIKSLCSLSGLAHEDLVPSA